MALDTRLRRGSSVFVGMPWRTFIPKPDGAISTEDRYALGWMYSGIIATAPTLVANIPEIAVPFDTGAYEFNLSLYFEGATSYAIDPAVETGWDFDTATGILTIDTDVADSFGPYTVTASNANGDADSNAFGVYVTESSGVRSQGLHLQLSIGL